MEMSGQGFGFTATNLVPKNPKNTGTKANLPKKDVTRSIGYNNIYIYINSNNINIYKIVQEISI